MAIQAVAFDHSLPRNSAMISQNRMNEIIAAVDTRLRDVYLWGFLVDYPEILPEHIISVLFEEDIEEWYEKIS